MNAHTLLAILAILCFGAASLVAAKQESWVAALFCGGVFFVALAETGLIDS